MSDLRLFYLTAPDEATAEAIGRSLVESRLAACVNILGKGKSIYWWDGAVQAEPEVYLLGKTRADLVDALIRHVTDRHPYEVPCVVALPIEAGHPPFLDWIRRETAP